MKNRRSTLAILRDSALLLLVVAAIGLCGSMLGARVIFELIAYSLWAIGTIILVLFLGTLLVAMAVSIIIDRVMDRIRFYLRSAPESADQTSIVVSQQLRPFDVANNRRGEFLDEMKELADRGYFNDPNPPATLSEWIALRDKGAEIDAALRSAYPDPNPHPDDTRIVSFCEDLESIVWKRIVERFPNEVEEMTRKSIDYRV